MYKKNQTINQLPWYNWMKTTQVLNENQSQQRT